MSYGNTGGRPLKMKPLAFPGSRIGCLWSQDTLGTYQETGGHVGITNHSTADTDLCVWIGDIHTFEYSGGFGTHVNPDIRDVEDLHIRERVIGNSIAILTQDPFGRYVVWEDDPNDSSKQLRVHKSDGVNWNAAQITYAKAYIRKFGITIPSGALYEPLVAPSSTIYLVSADDNIAVVGNFLT